MSTAAKRTQTQNHQTWARRKAIGAWVIQLKCYVVIINKVKSRTTREREKWQHGTQTGGIFLGAKKWN